MPQNDDSDQVARDASALREGKAQFMLRLRARGISDLSVLRAVETVPRELFVPHRYLDLANRDISLPIGCGQTMPEPFLVARMMEALNPARHMRTLEIGAGSGYATAILSRLSGEVLAVERFQSLAIAASARLRKLSIDNAELVWMDALALTRQIGLFDRILVHAVLEGVPNLLLALLKQGGGMVMARSLGSGTGAHGQRLTYMTINHEGLPIETDICPCRMRPLIAGCSQAL